MAVGARRRAQERASGAQRVRPGSVEPPSHEIKSNKLFVLNAHVGGNLIHISWARWLDIAPDMGQRRADPAGRRHIPSHTRGKTEAYHGEFGAPACAFISLVDSMIVLCALILVLRLAPSNCRTHCPNEVETVILSMCAAEAFGVAPLTAHSGEPSTLRNLTWETN